MAETILKGIPAAPGITIGKAHLIDSEDFTVSKRHITEAALPNEINRFQEALMKTRDEILKIKDKISKEMGIEHGEIFSAHLLVLEDALLLAEVVHSLVPDTCEVHYHSHGYTKDVDDFDSHF